MRKQGTEGGITPIWGPGIKLTTFDILDDFKISLDTIFWNSLQFVYTFFDEFAFIVLKFQKLPPLESDSEINPIESQRFSKWLSHKRPSASMITIVIPENKTRIIVPRAARDWMYLTRSCVFQLTPRRYRIFFHIPIFYPSLMVMVIYIEVSHFAPFYTYAIKTTEKYINYEKCAPNEMKYINHPFWVENLILSTRLVNFIKNCVNIACSARYVCSGQ